MDNLTVITDQRLGAINTNKFGNEMMVCDYIKENDIWVKFINTDEEPVHTSWKSFCKGATRSRYDKTTHRVGYIGIGEYKVSINEIYTPQHTSWNRMIQRCYGENHLKRNPTYRGCSVVEEWHNFQTFAKWYDDNYYEIEGERMCLDKDILVKGNKIYSPDTCIFVPHRINSLFIKSDSRRGNLPIGVHYSENRKNKYQVNFNIGNGGKKLYLGCFKTPEEAFNTYKEAKERKIKEIAEKYKDKIPSVLYKTMINYEVEITD